MHRRQQLVWNLCKVVPVYMHQPIQSISINYYKIWLNHCTTVKAFMKICFSLFTSHAQQLRLNFVHIAAPSFTSKWQRGKLARISAARTLLWFAAILQYTTSKQCIQLQLQLQLQASLDESRSSRKQSLATLLCKQLAGCCSVLLDNIARAPGWILLHDA